MLLLELYQVVQVAVVVLVVELGEVEIHLHLVQLKVRMEVLPHLQQVQDQWAVAVELLLLVLLEHILILVDVVEMELMFLMVGLVLRLPLTELQALLDLQDGLLEEVLAHNVLGLWFLVELVVAEMAQVILLEIERQVLQIQVVEVVV